jgi:hypothetical protein
MNVSTESGLRRGGPRITCVVVAYVEIAASKESPQMALKDIVENNPVLLSLSLLLAGFIAGITTYDAILRIAHLETVSASQLKEQEDTIAKSKQEAVESAQKIATLTIDIKNLSYQLDDQRKLISHEMLSQLDGDWINQNPKTRGITRFQIIHRGSDVFVHAWGACTPTDCDWGEQKALIDQDSAIVLWDQGFVFTKMVIRLNKKTNLTADYLSVFTDKSGRPKSEAVEIFSYQQKTNSTASGESVPSPTAPSADSPGVKE